MKKNLLVLLFIGMFSASFANVPMYETTVQRGVETSSGLWDVYTCTTTKGESCDTPGSTFRIEYKKTILDYIEDGFYYLGLFK